MIRHSVITHHDDSVATNHNWKYKPCECLFLKDNWILTVDISCLWYNNLNNYVRKILGEQNILGLWANPEFDCMPIKSKFWLPDSLSSCQFNNNSLFPCCLMLSQLETYLKVSERQDLYKQENTVLTEKDLWGNSWVSDASVVKLDLFTQPLSCDNNPLIHEGQKPKLACLKYILERNSELLCVLEGFRGQVEDF